MIKILTLVSAVLLLVSCNNEAENNSTVSADSTGVATDWKTGIALFSFHRHPFTTAIAMADSAEVKYVEGFSFYKLGPAFADSTMGKLDKEGIDKMKQMLDEKNIRLGSMYEEGAKTT